MTQEFFSQYLEKNIPIAHAAGIKLENISDEKASMSVSLSLMSQNPFKSMFWAIQGMAAEFSTGVLCMKKIAQTQQNISMLVIKQEGKFTKKAIGQIVFTCEQGNEINKIIDDAVTTKEGQIITVESQGRDEAGDIVSTFKFTWSFIVRK